MKATYLIGLLVLSILILSGCTQQVNQNAQFIDEYNAKLTRVNQLIVEHNSLVTQINNNLNNTAVNRQKLKEYVDWVEKNRPTLSNFQFYVETNYKKIQEAGQNPDYIRANVVKTLDVMGQNEVNFRSILASE